MRKVFIDTETCGFHGPIVLLQYAFEDEPVQLYHVWDEPAQKTIALLEEISHNIVVGYNLAFDWFHICQLYTTLLEYQERYPATKGVLVEELYAKCEPAARDRGCLKPAGALDLMLYSRKVQYQYLMDRKPIAMRRVPSEVAPQLCEILNELLPFRPIFFARYKDKHHKPWNLYEDKAGVRFQTIKCMFAPSTGLKSLVADVFPDKYTQTFGSIAPDPAWEPIELGYAPFAEAVQQLTEWKGKRPKRFHGEWKGAWPQVIEYHQSHWAINEQAQEYARNDVEFLRALYDHFGAADIPPQINDTDSILACMVGAVRWRGFRVNCEYLQELRAKAVERKEHFPTAPRDVLRYMLKNIDDMERLMVPSATDKQTLTHLVQADEEAWAQIQAIDKRKYTVDERQAALNKVEWALTISRKAFEVLEARKAQKEIEMYDKLLIAGRLHASLKVIGTLSSRMAGDNKLNVQGIKRTKYVRKAFPLAWEGMTLSGGDFAGFEVTIADAVYDDPKLRADLTSYVDCVYCDGTGKTQEGSVEQTCGACGGTGQERMKIHAIFGTHIFPEYDYKGIRLTAGKVPDLYTIAKSGLFTWLFAGTERSFEERLGVPAQQAKDGLLSFESSYPLVGQRRREAMFNYCPVWSGDDNKFHWREHKKSVTTLLGFSRYFDLEYAVVRTLFELPDRLPTEWKDIPSRVMRGTRIQTLYGATCSAIYGAVFSLQNYVARVAINHPIQGTGAQITKELQARIWALQPAGYSPWQVMPLNVHDEIMVPVAPARSSDLESLVTTVVDEQKQTVPLLEIEWHSNMGTWADK
jgi:hypothetical protein